MPISWLLLTLLALPGQAADTALVCPPALRLAIQPWSDYRIRQGHRIAMVDGSLAKEQIRAQIRRLATLGKLRFIVLVGDADLPSPGDRAAKPHDVPTHYAPAKVNLRWGSEPEIATDSWYADLDDDDVPDVAVGRLSVDSPAQLATVVRKIISYESQAPRPAAGGFPAENLRAGDLWRRRINLVAGLGGFGPLIDSALETAAKAILVEGIPASYSTSFTQASWRSPYCPPPALFGQTAIGRLNEGCLFWVYLGHGGPHELDHVRVPGEEYPILRMDDAARIYAVNGPPIALFLACYSAAYDARGDCLAEALLRCERGPVAAIGGSRVTMPYAMSVLGVEMLEECFVARRPTIGEVLLYAKRNMVLAARDDERSRRIDSLAALLSPAGSELADERLEHVQLFNLLGDPLLGLRHPLGVRVETASAARPGDRLSVTGVCEIDGPATVELIVRRDRLTFRPAPRQEYRSSSAAADEYLRTYSAANDARLAAARTTVTAGRFATEMIVPEHAQGECHVRVFVQGRGQFAAGAADLRISPP